MMSNPLTWLYIAVAVGVALLGNSVSAIWAAGESKFSLWLLAVVLISPFVFITFGLVTARLGVAVTSGTIDSLLTLSTILVGLFLFNEWSRVSPIQYAGMALAVVGIFLMLFAAKPGG